METAGRCFIEMDGANAGQFDAPRPCGFLSLSNQWPPDRSFAGSLPASPSNTARSVSVAQAGQRE